MPRVFWYTFHRADFDALRRIKMPHALSTQHGVYLVNFETLVDGLIGTFGLAHIAVDAFFSDGQCQGQLLVDPNCSLSACSISDPTNWETSPPRRATSLTRLEDMNP